MSRSLHSAGLPRAIRRFLAACTLLAAAAAAPLPGAAQGEFPQRNTWARVTPSVVWCGDPSSTVKIEVHILGRDDVASVQVTNGGESSLLTLYDDGTHGDANAGDNVFTVDGVCPYCNPRNLKYGGAVGAWWGFLRVQLKDGQRLANNYGIVAGLVNPLYKGAFQVRDLGNGLSATAYAFFIQDSRHEVIDSYPVANVYCGTANFQAYRKLYSILPDAFDIAVLTPGLQIVRPDGFGENVPYHITVANQVQHIGLPIEDKSAQFGSGGRLESAVYHSFGSIQIFDHEVAHQWGAGLGASLGLLEGNSGPYGHWLALSDVGGQLGAYYFSPDGKVGHLAANGDGTWRLIPNTENEPYSPLELYAMGLIPPEQVPPIHILTSPDLSNADRITAASVRTVTIDEIMGAEGGPRIPPAGEAPKELDVAYMVTQDVPYDEAAYAYFSLMSYALMRQVPPEPRDNYAPFYWATGGRGRLNCRLPVDVPEPALLPDRKAPTATPAPTEAPTATKPAPSDTPAPTRAPGEAPTSTAMPVEVAASPAPTATSQPSRPRGGLCGILPAGLVLAAGGGALCRRRLPRTGRCGRSG